MNEIAHIKTIGSVSETKFKEKNSVFYGFAFPIKSVDDATEKLVLLRKKYFDASHHCFAYRLSKQIFKYSDDGEPNGTAGIRILNAIDHFNLTNVLSVVVRYFGGTKLGVGPLGKAYYNSAVQTIESAQIIIQKPYQKMVITSDYLFVNPIHRLLASCGVKIEESSFNQKVEFHCFVNSGKVEKLSYELKELSKGDIKILIENSIVYL
ncbi:MAG: IMPACT family protein [Ignavibacteriaceae bacterium]